MQLVRPVIARHPKSFGRLSRDAVQPVAEYAFGGDLKLFATTFLAGFLFVSILIG
jgi:hypothetical protein